MLLLFGEAVPFLAIRDRQGNTILDRTGIYILTRVN